MRWNEKPKEWADCANCDKTILLTRTQIVRRNKGICHRFFCGRRCMGLFRRNEGNTQWKADDVGFYALHQWVRRRMVMPDKCQDCGKVARLDLANISQEYQRNLTDWEWLCRKCHMVKDGRDEKLAKLTPPPWAPESRAKLSASQKALNRSGEQMAHFSGQKHSPETLVKMRDKASQRTRDNLGRFNV